MVKVQFTMANGSKVSGEWPDTVTVPLRSGSRMREKLIIQKLAFASFWRIFVYGVRQLVKDGAPSFATIDRLEGNSLKYWNALKDEKGVNLDTKAKSVNVSAAMAAKLVKEHRKAGTLIPGFKDVAAFAKFVEDALTAHSVAYAKARIEAMYSGDIAETQSVGDPVATQVRAWLANVLRERAGYTAKDAMDLIPTDMDAMRSWFVGFSEIPNDIPDRGPKDKWFDNAKASIEAEIQRSKDTRANLL